MSYWLDQFTRATWQQFLDAGATVVGFKESQRDVLARVRSGDILLCYLGPAMSFVGALEIVRPSQDRRPIWGENEYPVRFDVRPLLTLGPRQGVPMREVADQIDVCARPPDAAHLQEFLNRFRPAARSRSRRLQLAAPSGEFGR